MPEIQLIRVLHSSPSTIIFTAEEQVGWRNGWIIFGLILRSNSNLYISNIAMYEPWWWFILLFYLRIEAVFQSRAPGFTPLKSEATNQLFRFILSLTSRSSLQGWHDIPKSAQIGFQKLHIILQFQSVGRCSTTSTTSSYEKNLNITYLPILKFKINPGNYLI